MFEVLCLKEKKKIIIMSIILICLITITLGILLYFKNNNNLDEVKVHIIQLDNADGKEEIIKKYTKKKGEIVDLNSFGYYDCGRQPSNIKILKITKNYVKISRNGISYRLIGKYKGKKFNEIGVKMYSLVEGRDFESYTEEVIDNIEYGIKTSFSIDQTSPNSPECSQARYTLFVEFSK